MMMNNKLANLICCAPLIFGSCRSDETEYYDMIDNYIDQWQAVSSESDSPFNSSYRRAIARAGHPSAFVGWVDISVSDYDSGFNPDTVVVSVLLVLNDNLVEVKNQIRLSVGGEFLAVRPSTGDPRQTSKGDQVREYAVAFGVRWSDLFDGSGDSSGIYIHLDDKRDLLVNRIELSRFHISIQRKIDSGVPPIGTFSKLMEF
jgi:hypothetical protein